MSDMSQSFFKSLWWHICEKHFHQKAVAYGIQTDEPILINYVYLRI